ncbi:MAG: hypothetical protein WCK49_04485 [Myxococcaceae bacterium]
MSESLSNTPSEVGLRFKSARCLVRLSRKDFCEKHGLNRFTVQSWETGRNFSRSKNVNNFCEALAKEGIFCTVEWLLEGVGTQPTKLLTRKTLELPTAQRARAPERKRVPEEQARIQAEAEFFQNNQPGNHKIIVSQVADNLMEPFFSEGDFVGGPLLTGSDIHKLMGRICLVVLDEENYVVRRLRTEDNRYLLVPEDTAGTVTGLRKMIGAAEIIWHRKLVRFAND